MPHHPVAIVTGGAQGIGLGIVRTLLARGWCVAALDVDSEALEALAQEQADAAQRVLCRGTDVADEDAVRAAVDAVAQRYGALHGLVNNAGIADPVSGPVERLERAQWQRWLDVNLTGAFLMAKHTLPLLAAHRGAIVNIASTRALQSEPDCEAYAASKGGLVALTHALAISQAGKVRVNAVSPGWIAVEEYRKPSARHAPTLRAQDHAQHPAGRVGTPEDIAALCAFLLSEQAGFITGAHIVADGGMTRKMIYAP